MREKKERNEREMQERERERERIPKKNGEEWGRRRRR